MTQEMIDEERKSKELRDMRRKAMNDTLEELLSCDWWCERVDSVAIYDRVAHIEERVKTWYGSKKVRRKIPVFRVYVNSRDMYLRPAHIDWQYGDITWREFAFTDEQELRRIIDLMKHRLPLICIEG